jgi:hypothetical protein
MNESDACLWTYASRPLTNAWQSVPNASIWEYHRLDAPIRCKNTTRESEGACWDNAERPKKQNWNEVRKERLHNYGLFFRR